MILCVAATATQLELLSPLILGLHVMWKTPWAGSTSSSDDRGFTCQLGFIILSRFVVYSTEFNVSYVKYLPIAVFFFFFSKAQRRIWGLHFVLLSLNQINNNTQLGISLDCVFFLSGYFLNTLYNNTVTPKVKVDAL